MRKKTKVLQIPKYREVLIKPHKQVVAYAPEGIFKNSTYRRCPSCYSKQVKRNGRIRPNGKYRYRCNSCKKNFTITIDAIDIDRLFAEEYDDYYQDIPYMHTTKYRKLRAFKENKEVRKLFNEIISEYQVDQGFPDDEKDVYAFHVACKLAGKLDQQEIDRYCDSWHYLANYYDGDVTYHLRFYNNHLACRYNIAPSKVQNLEQSLLHCDKCGSASIVRQGFNNNGRRRIKCNDCQRVSVIRVKHLITQQEFESFLQSFFAERTHDQKLIDSLIAKMSNDYYKISISHHFEALLSEQMVITYALKEDIFNAFIAAEYLRTFPKNMLEYLFELIEYEDLYNSYQQIPNLASKTNFLEEEQMLYSKLRDLPDKIETKDVSHTRLFYQVAAAMHTSHFHDWHHRANITFEEMKATMPLVKERRSDTQ